MKHKILVVCCAAIVLFSCNSETKDAKTENIDTTAVKADDVKKEEAWVAVDSATEMKAWMEYATPGEPHKALASSNGTWVGEVTSWMKKDAPPVTSTSTMTNRMAMDGRYQLSDFKGSFMGMPFNGMSITGYDNAKKKFVSTWIDNMGTGLMNMEGTWDEATKSMNMTGKMTNPANGKECQMREVFKMVDENTQLMEMYGPDSQTGKEYKTMEIKLTRKK
ncbi:MAG: DUF1579 domain-containing protein [Bacteroidota bacterium]